MFSGVHLFVVAHNTSMPNTRTYGRTVAEVAHWVSMSEPQKELVWQRILAQGYPRRNR